MFLFLSEVIWGLFLGMYGSENFRSIPRFSLRYFAIHVQGVRSLNSLRVHVPKFGAEVFMFL